MSTFLQLCKKTRQNCLLAGTGPTAVTNQVGELKDIVDWVADAYVDVQLMHGGRWRWLRHGFTLNTVASTASYAYTSAVDSTSGSAISRFGSWVLSDPDNLPKIYLTSGGVGTERWLIPAEWPYFNTTFGIGTQNTGYPSHIAITPQDKLKLGLTPDADYTITGEYYRSPQVLAADSDTPEMPSQFHDVIVYIAMQKYGLAENAPEITARGEQEARRMLKQLEALHLPRIRLGGPLV